MQYIIAKIVTDINYLITASLIIDPLLTGMKREWEKGRNRRERKEKEKARGDRKTVPMETRKEALHLLLRKQDSRLVSARDKNF